MNFLIFIMLLLEGFLMIAIMLAGVVVIYFIINSRFMCNPPPVPSSGKGKTVMIEDAAGVLAKRQNQLIMDLGSGWGSLLLPLAKRFPQHHFIGIEYGYIPYFVSKLRSRKMPNITYYRQDFFKSDISKADIIFMFLINKIMPKIEDKCSTEAKKGALIYSNRFPMPRMQEKRKVSLGSKYNTYYVYKI